MPRNQLIDADAHRRSAALIYARPPSTVTNQQRLHGKVLNVLAAHGHLDRIKLIAELADISETVAHDLVRLYRERVLGVTNGVDK